MGVDLCDLPVSREVQFSNELKRVATPDAKRFADIRDMAIRSLSRWFRYFSRHYCSIGQIQQSI